jgi:hypothetical protein
MPSEALRRFVVLLVALHEEMEAGRDDGPRAERLRDEMDGPLGEMSKEENEWSRQLSEDLYGLHEAEQNHLGVAAEIVMDPHSYVVMPDKKDDHAAD